METKKSSVVHTSKQFGKYVLKQTLGKGATSITKVGLDPQTGKRVAIKILFHSNNADELKQRRRAFEQERKLLSRVKHKNVMRLEFVDWDVKIKHPSGDVRNAAVLGLELCQNGELMDHLLASAKFSEVVARTIFKSIVEGLHACHKADIAHRDLKPENILVDHNFDVKIADFGFSRLDSRRGMETHVGTLPYMAPEILSGIPYTKSADVWSIGVILFILVVGYPPYQRPTSSDYWWHALVTQRDNARFWGGHMKVAQGLSFPKDLKDLLWNLLEVSTGKRLTCAQILAHPWLKGKILTQSELAKTLSERSAGSLEAILKRTNSPGEDKRQAQVFRDALDSGKRKTLAEAIQKAITDAEKGLVKPILLPSSFVGGAMQLDVEGVTTQQAYVKLLEAIQKMQPSTETLGKSVQDRLQVIGLDVDLGRVSK
uniref:Protein kinase domain-containing protein n=1 Tax=Lotharella globosa TaxID=91324 RepID=A0A6V3IZJ3_9EUKA